jgi:STE24 endopeptidase
LTSQVLFTILLIITIAGFAFDQWIGYLNTTTWSNILPDALKGFYDEQTYSKQQDYERVNYRFGLFSDVLSFFAIMAMLIFGGFAGLMVLPGCLVVLPSFRLCYFSE